MDRERMENVSGHIRHSLTTLSRLEFDHDRAYGLPLRRDALDFARSVLFRPGSTLLGSADFGFPEVVLDADGTAHVAFTAAPRVVLIWVPCGGVVVVVRAEAGADLVEMVFRGDPPEEGLGTEVAAALAWLGGAP